MEKIVSGIDFSQGKHTKYVNKYGIEVPSVTTILKILNKPALQKWANWLGFRRENVDRVLERSASMGTLFHNAMEAYMKGDSFHPVYNYEDEEYKLKIFLNAFFEWKENHTIEPLLLEEELNCDYFGGTMDFYGIIDGKRTILDYKTSKGTYASMFLQLAAYTFMMEKKGFIVEQVGILNINEKGNKWTYFSRTEIDPYIEVFLKLAEFFHIYCDLLNTEGWGIDFLK